MFKNCTELQIFCLAKKNEFVLEPAAKQNYGRSGTCVWSLTYLPVKVLLELDSEKQIFNLEQKGKLKYDLLSLKLQEEKIISITRLVKATAAVI